ncbi:DUF1206 domain-containing protein [Isoptericola variabilis]|uniref:DUF1206 domain-containing protein n=1 Tax=Isoptericola variabilis TaxID=139208 RepID=UPI001E5875AA|nr:DUF1206 domain-containing protein [Isoptericola variabilis]
MRRAGAQWRGRAPRGTPGGETCLRRLRARPPGRHTARTAARPCAAWRGSATRPPASCTSSQAGGIDGALRTIRDQGFGTVLLVVVGVGIAAYGAYSFARARYARLLRAALSRGLGGVRSLRPRARRSSRRPAPGSRRSRAGTRRPTGCPASP